MRCYPAYILTRPEKSGCIPKKRSDRKEVSVCGQLFWFRRILVIHQGIGGNRSGWRDYIYAAIADLGVEGNDSMLNLIAAHLLGSLWNKIRLIRGT
jgi:hypothetical protein